MSRRTLVIVNPASRNGKTRRTFLALESRLRDALGSLEIDWTKGPRDAERLAAEGARAGVERILVAGGDGTASEVVAGILGADRGDQVELGLLPLGTGSDLVRGLGLPRKLDDAVAAFRDGAVRRIDAGRLHFVDHDGEPQTSHFINSATLGVSGMVCSMVNDTTKVFGGTISFLVGTIRALLRFRPAPVRLVLDGETVYEGDLVLATANNGSHFGGGMHGAPGASFVDGLLDVVVIPGLSKAELLFKLPLLYTGGHVDDPSVQSFRGRKLEVSTPGVPHHLEIDGEPRGTTPATFEVLPGAIRLVGITDTPA